MTPFNIAPGTTEEDATVTLAEGETCTISLYTASGAGLLPGCSVLVIQDIDGVEQTVDALSGNRATAVLDAKGDWIIRRLASANAFGVNGV